MADEKIAGIKIPIGLDGSGLQASGVKVQATAKGITQALNNISGVKAEQKLEEIRKAVEKLGGVSNLTGPQLGRLRGELDKLAAAGAKIPKSLELPKISDSSAAGVGKFADSLGKVSTTLARSASLFGLPADAFRTIDDAADIAELGVNGLTKGLAGFNAMTLGVVGVGAAAGVALGTFANKFEIVRTTADDATRGLFDFLQASGLFGEASRDAGAGATNGLKNFRFEMAGAAEEAKRLRFEGAGGIAAFAQGALTASDNAKLLADASKVVGFEIKNLDQAKAILKVAEDSKTAADAQRKLGEEAKRAAAEMEKLKSSLSGAETVSTIERTNKAIDQLGGLSALAVAPMRSLWKEVEQLVEQGVKLPPQLQKIADLQKILAGNKPTVKPLDSSRLFAEQDRGPVLDLFGGKGALDKFREVIDPLQNAKDATIDWAGEVQNLANLAQTLPGIFGSALGGLLSGVAGIGGAINNLKDKFSKGLGGIGGALTGKQGIGALFGSLGQIGTIAGAAFGIGKSLVSGIKKLFGGESAASKAAKAGGKILGRDVSEEMAKEVLARAKETGKSVEQVFRDIKVEELTGKLGDLQNKRGAAVSQIQTGLAFFGKVKGAAAAQGRIFGAQFAAVVKAEGFDKALEIFRETFSGLPEDVKAAIPADIQKLFAFGENEQFAAALDAASALAESFKGTVGLIGLSTQTMADFGEVAKATFDEAAAGAVAAGATQEEAQRAALQAVLPLLIQMQTAAKETGVALDANTQALIDQAKAAGIEIPVDPLLQVVDILKEISLVLKEIGGIEVTPKINVPNVPGATPGGSGGGGPSFASGGIGKFDRRGTTAELHGLEAIVPLDRREDGRRVMRMIAGLRPELITEGLRAAVAATPSLRIPSFESGGIADFGGALPGPGGGGAAGVTVNLNINTPISVEAMGDVETIGDQMAAAFRAEVPRLMQEVERAVERGVRP